jgi:hypothetical protein
MRELIDGTSVVSVCLKKSITVPRFSQRTKLFHVKNARLTQAELYCR